MKRYCAGVFIAGMIVGINAAMLCPTNGYHPSILKVVLGVVISILFTILATSKR